MCKLLTDAVRTLSLAGRSSGLFCPFPVRCSAYILSRRNSDPAADVGTGGAVSPANGIRRSTDGGEHWQTIFEGINTRSLAHSARDPQVVYASGINQTGTLFFATSPDFGDSWETVEMEDSPTGIKVNDMISVMQGGQEVLYLGANKGCIVIRLHHRAVLGWVPA